MIYQVHAFTPRGPSLAAMLAGQHPPLPDGRKRQHVCLDEQDAGSEMFVCIVCEHLLSIDDYYITKRKSGTLKRDKRCKRCRNEQRAKKPCKQWQPHPTIALVTRRMTVREFGALIGKKPSSVRRRLDSAFEHGVIHREIVRVVNTQEPAVYFMPLGWKK